MQNPWKVSATLVGISAALFITSLFFSCFSTDATYGKNGSSFLVVILGWFGLFDVLLCPANIIWLANPLLGFSWIFILARIKVAAVPPSVAAFVLGFAFMFCPRIIAGLDGANDRPIVSNVTELNAGYYLWLASLSSGLVAAALVPSERRLPPLPSRS